jgi:hypothetical protein
VTCASGGVLGVVLACVVAGATSWLVVTVLVADLVTLDPFPEMVAVFIARSQFEFVGYNLIG